MIERKNVADILSSGWNALRTGKRFADKLAEAGVDEQTFYTLEEYLLALEMMENKESSEESTPLATQIRELLGDCYGWGVKLRLRLETAYGRDSQVFRSFPSDRLNKGRRHLSVMTEAMKSMLIIAKKYHGLLQEHGQTDDEIIVGENLQKRLIEMQKKARILQESSGENRKESLTDKILQSAGEIKDAGEKLFINQPEVQIRFQNIDLEK